MTDHDPRPADVQERSESLAQDGASSPPSHPARWPWMAGGGFILLFVGVVLFLIWAPKPNVWTDDAYVMVHYSTIAPRVAGQVAKVEVDDNQVVRAGQVLATLDDRDYRTAVDIASAALERDRARIVDAQANVARQQPLIEQQQAEIAAAQARLSLAQSDTHRYRNLAATGAGTVQERQQAEATLQADDAALRSAQAALSASERQLDVLRSHEAESRATVQADQAQLDQARLNLSYTRILAPIDGMIGERGVQVGNYISPGAPLMTIIPLSQIYIQANYREVDLRHVLPGQKVTIHVDAYDLDLEGVVDSVPPASGATFEPIAPNNATGNFTKIVQRLPVKISIKPGQPLARLLRVGFSVETTIHTGLADVAGAQRGNDAPVTAH